ncbi:hypothetical protein APHAL10511_007165 [Amanita phalloides]|nr:hypothetical protein APHAL10511_007165 [Amanita phalloides]
MAGLSTPTLRHVPEIGGSATGFIVLIVFLILIIVASSFAILHFIRDERFTHHRHRRYEQPSTSGSPFIYDASSDRRLSWRRLFKHFHSRSEATDTSSRGHPSIPVRGGRGCYQIGSGDSWDHTMAQTTEVHSHPHEAYPDDASPADSPALSDTNPYGHRTFIHHRDSCASSMHLDTADPRKPMSLSSPSLSPSNLEMHHTLSPLPPDSPTPMLVGSPSPRSGSSMSRRAISPLPEPAVPPGIGRTFEGGSKFLEAL